MGKTGKITVCVEGRLNCYNQHKRHIPQSQWHALHKSYAPLIFTCERFKYKKLHILKHGIQCAIMIVSERLELKEVTRRGKYDPENIPGPWGKV